MQHLTKLIQQLKGIEEEKAFLGKKIRKWDSSEEFNTNIFRENKIILPVEIMNPLDATMAGVDGGLVQRELHGLDLIVTRASAAFFSFKSGKLDDYFHIPHNRTPEIIGLNAMDNHTFQVSASLFRIEKELDVAIEATKANPDVLLMDGSLVPTYVDEPEGEAKGMFQKIKNKYQRLYEECYKKNILLAGIIEDSRGKRFSGLLSKQLPLAAREQNTISRITDTSLLHYMLQKGERTCFFEYYSEDHKPREMKHPILSFYLKSVSDDIPIRVEFLGLENFSEEASKLSSLIYTTSKFNSRYAIPPVLIEADQRAKLTSNDVDLIISALLSKVGHFSSIRDLRRNRRPF